MVVVSVPLFVFGAVGAVFIGGFSFFRVVVLDDDFSDSFLGGVGYDDFVGVDPFVWVFEFGGAVGDSVESFYGDSVFFGLFAGCF